MKKFVIAYVMGIALSFVSAQPAKAATGQLEEIPVGKVFIPEYGYDDNDQVGLISDGLLPNGCYTVGPARIEVSRDGHTLRLRQYAFHDTSGVCDIYKTSPDEMKRAVPFTIEVPVGQLRVGSYRIQYLGPRSVAADRVFTVSAAPTRSVDSLPYALVTAIDLPDFLPSGTLVTPAISGTLTSTCSRLNPNVQILNEGDVFVALPTVSDAVNPSSSVSCADVMRSFRVDIRLGQLAPGRYLLHVRSMNGKAVNKVFSVYQN